MCKTSECVWNMESIVRGVMCVRQVSVCGVWSIARGVICKTGQCVWSMEYCKGCDM